jgi:hypothetical protein
MKNGLYLRSRKKNMVAPMTPRGPWADPHPRGPSSAPGRTDGRPSGMWHEMAAMQACARPRRCPRGASWGCRRVVSAGRGAGPPIMRTSKKPRRQGHPRPRGSRTASAARPRVSAQDRVGQVEAPESSSCGRGPRSTSRPGRTRTG